MSVLRRRVFCDVQDGRDKVVVHTLQDCSEITKVNRATMAENGVGTSSFWKGRKYVKIASIPNNVINQWHQQGLNFYDPNDWKIIKRLLNSIDYSDFRTAPGRF